MKLVADGLKTVFATDLVAQLLESLRIKLDHPSGLHADQVIVCAATGDDLEITLFVVEKNLFEYAGIMQVGQGSVNRRATDAMIDRLEFFHEHIG